MNVREKYTTATLNEKDKTVISNDTYVIAQLLEELIIQMRRS